MNTNGDNETRYATVIADWPWQYSDRMLRMKSTGNGAAAQYRVMAAENAERFFDEALGIQLADDAHLWMWTTNAFIEHAHIIARGWGFKPKTVVTWVKGRLSTTGAWNCQTPILIQHIGQGRHLRNSTEHVVFAVRGKPTPRVRNLPTAFVYPARWPGRKHSEKPPVIHEWAEKIGVGPRIEVFARTRRDGWDAIGDELEGEQR